MDVQRYVRSYDLCQRMKGGRRNNGLLQPLPIPDRPWQDISMDLITGLPLTANGFDAIFTFVDRLSKSVHLCPTSVTIDAAGAATSTFRTCSDSMAYLALLSAIETALHG